MAAGYPALYECLTPGTDKWVECSAVHCARQRRINTNVDMVIRLEHYKSKLDAKLPLDKIEQEDLEAIGKHVAEMVGAFVTALSEALRPAVEAIAAAAMELWNSLPTELQDALRTEPDVVPAVSLGDVATPIRNVDLNIARYEAAASQRGRIIS